MDTFDDIFSEIEPLFDGDEWDHRKISTDQIHKKYHKEISDDDDMVKKENGVEIQKSEIILLESKIDDEVIKKKREASAIESTNSPLVARKTNPRSAHRIATDPPQELIRGKSELKHQRINSKDFILPDGWATEIHAIAKGNSSGHKDTEESQVQQI
ncbi:hypothetical protein HAX54_022624 [Datura stramonium]|uniref:Uncharacterized protein n=1 Tax=Datura stramonium TaxID=4076 RepID=A0ABS8UUX7_DATST|nr:hypothetical protein [Datura stramonium]